MATDESLDDEIGQVVYPDSVWNHKNEDTGPQPVIVVAKATREEWRRGVTERGGTPSLESNYRYFYWVRTD